jgi:hypothetical protein
VLVFFFGFGFGFETIVPEPDPAAMLGAASAATRPKAATHATSDFSFIRMSFHQTDAVVPTSTVLANKYKSHLRCSHGCDAA